MLSGCGGGTSIDSKGGAAGSGGTPYTGNAILSWATPTTYSDGSPLPAASIKGYRVYSRTPSGTYGSGIQYFVSAPTTSVSVKNLNLPVGQYYFVATTLDSSDVESGFSNEVLADLK